ncbi:G5 domain-containing protein, partial [Streptococcus hillyeri]
ALKNIKNIEVKAPGLLAEVEKLRQELYGTTPAPQPDPKPQPTSPGPVETTEEIVVIEPIAPGEKRVANPDMEEGKETRTPGKDGEALVTYKVYKKDGVEYKREAISQTVKTAPVDTIIEYGTKKAPVVVVSEVKVEEPVPFTSREVDNPNLEKGQRKVVTPGKDGVKTVTYSVRTVDGKETERNKVSEEITTPAVEEVIEVGTKEVTVIPGTPIVVPVVKDETKTEVIPFEKQTRENPELAKGETRVVQEGKDGVRTIVYTVTTVDGQETGRVVKSDTTTPAVPEITEIGTKEVSVTPPAPVVKDETKTEVIPFEKQTRENPELAKGETRVVQEGKDGVRTIVYTVTTVDGQETGRVVKSDTTTPAVAEITEIGTKEVTVIPGTPIVVPVVKDETKSEVIPFEKQTRENPELAKGETRVVQEGKDGVRTIVYTVTTVDGQETGRVVKSDTTTPAVAEITEIGTKEIPVTPAPSKPVVKTETKHESIPFEKQTRKNPELSKGETRVVQEGKDGIRTIVYTVTMVDGKEVSRVIKAEGTTPAVPEIIEI